METLEELYNLEKHVVILKRVQTKSKRWLELFPNPKKQRAQKIPKGKEGGILDPLVLFPPGQYRVEVVFPEFTCKCPRTSQPDFATITIEYVPDKWCVELKALKYYLNSFRDEGHFHEEVTNLIYDDLKKVLSPFNLFVEGEFNVRGGTYPTVRIGERWGNKDEVMI